MSKIVDAMEEYTNFSHYIDGENAEIQKKAKELKEQSKDEIELIKKTYEYVRDEIQHSWDAKDRRVTAKASEVLREKVGICWAKSNLLAALLRANGIPTGICYQRLTFGHTPEHGYCIHALNAIYITSLERWIRLDARGNKPGVNAQFSLEQEQLAFPIRKDCGEIDYEEVYAEPLPKLMKVLESSTDAIEMYLHALPDEIE